MSPSPTRERARAARFRPAPGAACLAAAAHCPHTAARDVAAASPTHLLRPPARAPPLRSAVGCSGEGGNATAAVAVTVAASCGGAAGNEDVDTPLALVLQLSCAECPPQAALQALGAAYTGAIENLGVSRVTLDALACAVEVRSRKPGHSVVDST